MCARLWDRMECDKEREEEKEPYMCMCSKDVCMLQRVCVYLCVYASECTCVCEKVCVSSSAHVGVDVCTRECGVRVYVGARCSIVCMWLHICVSVTTMHLLWVPFLKRCLAPKTQIKPTE